MTTIPSAYTFPGSPESPDSIITWDNLTSGLNIPPALSVGVESFFVSNLGYNTEAQGKVIHKGDLNLYQSQIDTYSLDGLESFINQSIGRADEWIEIDSSGSIKSFDEARINNFILFLIARKQKKLSSTQFGSFVRDYMLYRVNTVIQ